MGDLGKLIMPKALKSYPKSNKSANLATLQASKVGMTEADFLSQQMHLLLPILVTMKGETNKIGRFVNRKKC